MYSTSIDRALLVGLFTHTHGCIYRMLVAVVPRRRPPATVLSKTEVLPQSNNLLSLHLLAVEEVKY